MAEHQSLSGSPDSDRDVTASEVASYAYCAKAWHLRYVLGKEPSCQASAYQDAGIAAHHFHGVAVRRLAWLERRAITLVAGLLLLAFVLVALVMLWPRLGSLR